MPANLNTAFGLTSQVRLRALAKPLANFFHRASSEKQKLTDPTFIDGIDNLVLYYQLMIRLIPRSSIPPAPVDSAGHHVAPEIPCSSYSIGKRGQSDLARNLRVLCENYNMHSHGKTVNELQAIKSSMSKTHLPKNNAPVLHAIRAAELLKKKKNTASGAGGSGIFVIELNTFLNRSWIYDTGCGTHICNTTQGLRASRKLKPGALSLYVGNGQREAVEAIGNFDLSLPSGLVIVLNNCHYAPSL
ncbi:hypothetical protein Tco_0434782 [Tanacetum coccineum]